MASTPITATNLANYIPVITSPRIKKALESELVVAKNCDMVSGDFSVGDRVNYPNLANMTSNAVNADQDVTLNDAVQNKDTLIINVWTECAIGIDDLRKLFAIPTTMSAFSEKCAYALAVNMDSYVNALINTLTNSVGAEGSALTSDVLANAYEKLNLGDAPKNKRFWVFDPESITDLLGIDMVVKGDYTGNQPWGNGYQGMKIFGDPVYVSTNLEAINTTYHGAAYLQKETFRVGVRIPIDVDTWKWKERSTWVIRAQVAFGAVLYRDACGCWIKTRS